MNLKKPSTPFGQVIYPSQWTALERTSQECVQIHSDSNSLLLIWAWCFFVFWIRVDTEEKKENNWNRHNFRRNWCFWNKVQLHTNIISRMFSVFSFNALVLDLSFSLHKMFYDKLVYLHVCSVNKTGCDL